MNVMLLNISAFGIAEAAEADELVLPAETYSCAFYHNYIYSTGSKGISVVDYSNPENPVCYSENDFSEEHMKDIYDEEEDRYATVNANVYVYENLLFAQANNGVINCFDLSKNPLNPEFIKQFQNSEKRRIVTMQLENNMLFVLSNDDITVFDFDTTQIKYRTEYRSKFSKVLSMRVYNGYIFALLGDRVISLNADTGEMVSQNVFDEGNPIGTGRDMEIADGHIVFAAHTSVLSWNQSYIASLDISDPENINEKKVKYITEDNANIVYEQIKGMRYKAGLLYVIDFQSLRLNMIDVQNASAMKQLEYAQLDGNYGSFDINDKYICIATGSDKLKIIKRKTFDIECDDVESTENPITISGTVLGYEGKITAEINGVNKETDVDKHGRFSFEIDDEFLPNGTYTANLSTENNEKSKEVNVTVNHSKRIDIKEENNTVTVINNRTEEETIKVLRAGYKDNMLQELYEDEAIVNGGEIHVFSNISIDESGCDFAVTYVVKKTPLGYTYVWDSLKDENDNPAELSEDNFTIEADCIHSEKKTNVSLHLPVSYGRIFVYAENPNSASEYITAAEIKDYSASFSFKLKPNPVEDKDYKIYAVIPYKGNYINAEASFRYYGENIINAILEKLDNETNSDNYLKIIEDNAEKLAVNLTEFDKLNTKYQNAVLQEVMAEKYLPLGSSVFKAKWNEAVAKQMENEKNEDALKAINSINSYSSFEKVFEEYYEMIKINLSEHKFFGKLSENGKKEIYKKLKIGSYLSIEEFTDDFDYQTALALINEAEIYNAEERMDSVSETLQLKFDEEFEIFTQMQRAKFFKLLTENKYESGQELQDAVDSIIEVIKTYKSTTQISTTSAYKSFSDSNRKFWGIAEYKGYAYGIYPGGVRIIDFNGDEPVDVTPDNADLVPGTTVQSYVNRCIQAKDGYLLAVVQQDKIIRKFSLEDPANPELTNTYSLKGDGDVTFIEYGDGNTFAKNNIVNIYDEKGNYYSINQSYNSIRYDDKKLYCAGSGKFDIYDVSDLSNIKKIGEKSLTYLNSDGKEIGVSIYDVAVMGNYAVLSYSKENWQRRNLWIFDISDPAKLSKQMPIGYKGAETMSRVGSLFVKNGILFASDIDLNIYEYDITNMPVITDLGTLSYNVNPASIVVDDGAIYFFALDGSLCKTSYKSSPVNVFSETITQRPIKISGTAIGQSGVRVKLNNIEAFAKTDALGNYTAEFDDDFVPNGEYTAEAYAISDESINTQGTVKVELPERYVIKNTYNANADKVEIENNSDPFEAIHITAGYKNNKIVRYAYKEFNVDKSAANANTLPDDEYSYVKSYILRKTDSGAVLVWEKTLSGTETKRTSEAEALNTDFEVKCDVRNEEKTVDIYAEGEYSKALVIVYSGTEALNNIEYIETLEPKKTLNFAFKDDPKDQSEYIVKTAAKGTDKYLYAENRCTYYSETTILPILNEIKNADITTIEGILKKYSDKLAIDLDDDSSYGKLGAYYKEKVLSAVMKDYTSAGGSVQLKRDFEKAVSEQTAEKDFYTKCAENFDKIKSCTAPEEMERIISISEILEIDTSKNGYGKLTSDYKAKVFNKLKANSYIVTEDSARTAAKQFVRDFDTYSAIEYINCSSFDNMETAFNTAKNIITLTFGNGFEQMTSTQKLYVYKEIANHADYNTAEEIQNAIDAAIVYVKVKYPNSSNGGGGGGGSSSGNGSSAPSADITPGNGGNQNNNDTGNSTAGFSDLENFDWAKKEIGYLSQNGVISGRSDDIFAPADNITREEFIKLAVCAFGYKESNSINFGFTDVDTKGWSAKYIQAAVDAGIAEGVSDNAFAPKSFIKREDMAVMLYRIMTLKNIDFKDVQTKSFNDSDSISDYSKEAVSKMAGCGIISGMDNGEFAPGLFANRAAAAKMIYMCMEYMGMVK